VNAFTIIYHRAFTRPESSRAARKSGVHFRTTDRKLADRELRRLKDEQGQVDRSQGKLTLAELCDHYKKTVQHQGLKTVIQETYVADRIRGNWPTGSLIQVVKVRPSDVDMWLARYQFGTASRNFHIQVLKDVFDLAVRDRIIVVSPAQHLKYAKRDKPIRRTPTFEQFQAIVASIRAQRINGHDADESAIPLYPQLRSLLEKRHAQKAADGRVFKIKDAMRAIEAACKRLKLPAYSHRSFRRMFIPRAIEKGIDVKVIAEWQGHRDGGKLILDTSSHVNWEHSQRMAQLMNDVEPENVLPIAAIIEAA